MKNLKINVPKGYEIDKGKSTFENIVFKEINKLPSSWEDLKRIEGYYIDDNSNVEFYSFTPVPSNQNTFKTKEQAKASIALAQLSQLRDVYRQGWQPDWIYTRENKYCIVFTYDNMIVDSFCNINHFLSFQARETAELFLENFRDLIEKAKPLMS
ncbi:MAG: hypothetical protein ABF244_06500 [Flavobacteriaceae bacterium]